VDEEVKGKQKGRKGIESDYLGRIEDEYKEIPVSKRGETVYKIEDTQKREREREKERERENVRWQRKGNGD